MWREETLQATSLRQGGSNSVVESQPSKLLVAGSIPVSRSKDLGSRAWVPAPHEQKWHLNRLRSR